MISRMDGREAVYNSNHPQHRRHEVKDEIFKRITEQLALAYAEYGDPVCIADDFADDGRDLNSNCPL